MTGGESFPLSYAQQRIWFMHRLEPASTGYNIPLAFRLTGPIRPDVLERVLREIQGRHEVLRTSYPLEAEGPVQRIDPESSFRLETVDLRHLPAPDREAEAERLGLALVRRPLDLDIGPVMRGACFQLGDADFALVIVIHHIATDGWSMGVLTREIGALYTPFHLGAASPLPELPIQYADFAVWQREWLEGGELATQLDYWRAELRDLPTEGVLAAGPRTTGVPVSCGNTTFPIPPELNRRLRAVARQEGASMFMMMLAAFKLLLHRLSGSTDIVVGTPVANRHRSEIEGLIGYFVNHLVLRTRCAGNPTFRELLRQVREVTLAGYANQDVPFDRLVEEFKPPRDPGRNPLFQVCFAGQNTSSGKASPLTGPDDRPSAFGVSGFSAMEAVIQFDLEALFWEVEPEPWVQFKYNAALFAPGAVEQIAGDLRALLGAIAASPDRRIDDFALAARPAPPSSPAAEPARTDDSMTTVDFLSQLRALDVQIWVDGERLKVNAPPGSLTPALRAELARRKEEITSLVRPAVAIVNQAIVPIPRTGDLPLSVPQRRLWFLDRLAPGSSTYNIGGGLRFQARIDTRALERAIDEIVRRQEALRTTFPIVDGSPRVLVTPFTPQRLQRIDLQSLPESDRATAAIQLTGDIARQPFDLETGPLFRAALIQIGPADFIFAYCMHHIISDGWSLNLFGRELAALYSAFAAGRPSPLPELAIQYIDYAAWQQHRLGEASTEAGEQYWLRQLRGQLPVLQLPSDRPRAPVLSSRGARIRTVVPSALTNELKELSQREGASLYMALLAAFNILLSRYTGDEDVIVGSPVANRGRTEVEGLIGFFVNTLVLRTDLSGNPTFRDVLRQVRGLVLQGQAHQDVPFDRLVELLRPARDAGHSPLFQVVFNSPTVPTGRNDATGVDVEIGTARFELTVELYEEAAAAGSNPDGSRWRAAGIEMSWEYNTDRFDRTTIAQMQRHYLRLLEGIVRNPAERLRSLPLLTDEELATLAATRIPRPREFPRDATVHSLIEAQAARTPDAVAVRHGDETISYRDLDGRANQLARRLQRSGIGPETLVGICLDRSIDMVVAVLAVFKAGGAYVPLDPSFPAERLHFMALDADLAALVTTTTLRDRVGTSRAPAILLDVEGASIAVEEFSAPPCDAGAGHLAYVIYTSGSTGKPKGVAIEHRSVVNFLTSMREEPGLGPDDRLLSVTTLSFDIAGLELYLPLIVGAQIILADRAVTVDATRLLELLTNARATVMQATPATWRLLLEAGWEGTAGLKILCGGEALQRDLAEQLLPRSASLWNMYGPTEATIWSLVHRVESGTGPVPIGRPIANTSAHLLDQELTPVPPGVTGELFLGGDGLARGYLARPELTGERFVPDPFGPPGARLYRTGDLARIGAGGLVEWIGRVDGQTKIRGFRIELGEIEAALADCAGVRQAAAKVVEPKPGDQRLLAYIVPANGTAPTSAELAAALRQRLPEYMVPSSYTVLTSLPLTPNGKVDRRALPSADIGIGTAPATFVAPGTETEQLIAAIWAEVLGVERVGLNDNFFDLGGHSLLIVRVHSRLGKALPEAPSLVELFQYPTVATLADRIQRGANAPVTFQGAEDRARRQLEA